MPSLNKQNMTDFSNKLSTKNISENDQLRSQYMHRIIRKGNRDVSKSSAPVIPYVLVQYWNDSTTIPSDVQKCIDSWKLLEKHYFKRFLFDDKSAEKFIKHNFDTCHLKAFNNCNHPAMRSDYFRLCFILVNGGFYVDADDVYRGGDFKSYFYDQRLKLQPLCYNTSTSSMVKISDAILAPYGSRELTFYANNDPIISPPNHPVIYMALERATQILNQDKGAKQDVQSITGPGNLTICLVRYAINNSQDSNTPNYELIADWDEIAFSQWPLEYRFDKRNWRLWDGFDTKVEKRKGDAK